jgi:hypothetical protein
LSIDEFNVGPQDATKILDEQIEKENYLPIYSSQKISKINNLKFYLYKDVYMSNYGDPVYDKTNNLIGYKINGIDYASIETFYNEDNLLCNKISIREFDQIKLSFNGDISLSWLDISTEFGFIREFNKLKYFYDKNNNLFNVETKYFCSQFPLYKKHVSLDQKIGTIDFKLRGLKMG